MFTSHRIASRRVASHRVASRRVASRRVASRRVPSCRVASCRVASRRVASRRVVSHRVASRRIASHRVELRRVAKFTPHSIATLHRTPYHARLSWAMSHHAASYGQFLKQQVLTVLPDPGALNSCMHTSPENNCWICYGLTGDSMHLDVGF